MKRYRITLTNGNHWVTTATNNWEARKNAHRDCKYLKLFGVHIERVECIES